MNSTPIRAAVLILRHHGVSVCIAGELALNYYNVPRVCHICVPNSSSLVAAGFLCSTGLFEPFELDSDFNNYTEYKRGFPRVRTTRWTYPPQAIVVFPAPFFGLDPIETILVPPSADQKVHISKEIPDLSQEEIANLPLPRLAPLLKGLAKRFLDTGDDVAMIAVEQLVDGMNLDEAWAKKQLEGSDATLITLVMNQIRSKKSRIDYFTENKITCFISDEEEAENVRLIPGLNECILAIMRAVVKTKRLNDAAIALHRVLSRERINFGIFGGYAIGAIGVSARGFQAISQSRQDYVAFFWSDRPDRKNAVLVEIFCEKFPGARYSMANVQCRSVPVRGLSLGQGTSSFLDPFYLFKGKVRAAATRAKFHDSADLRMLASRYASAIKSRTNELNLEYVGLAIKRYIELGRLIQQLGVDVEKAKRAAKHLDLNKLPPPAPGDVQRGLLAIQDLTPYELAPFHAAPTTVELQGSDEEWWFRTVAVPNSSIFRRTSGDRSHPPAQGLQRALTGTSSYARWLDTYEGTAGVSYQHGGVDFSYPQGVLAFRLTAGERGKLNVTFSLARRQWVLSQGARANPNPTDDHSIVMSANNGRDTNALTVWSEARIVNSGGETNTTANGEQLVIKGADTIDVLFDAQSSYPHPTAASARGTVARQLDAAVAAEFPTVRSAAIADFGALMRRVKLDLGSSGDLGIQKMPTCLDNFGKNPAADPELTTLMFNFGPNLQCIWNPFYQPAWQSKYTININLQMNYWPALITNLAEVQKPVFDLIDMAIPRAQVVAKSMYGCDGIVMHHNTDLWGDSAPVDKGTPYTVWPMSAAWLASDAMEHYRWTKNKTFLQQTVWPLLQKTTQFYYCYLFEWNGYWTVGPSLSPEHAFIVPPSMSQAGKPEGLDISIEMDNQLLHNLFTNINQTCTILGLDAHLPDCAKANAYLPRIHPPRIGPENREILEWQDEYDEEEPAHRRLSSLWGLYPGKQLTPLVSPTYAKAGKALLDRRIAASSGSTRWSRS
ncbi:hypothetical protein DL766_009367 [Monosporascus sp. MC13-8B]|nr:hypothetical protein DL763_006978 [Monosporascus cannonballus]RYP15608.1 hypothetical protein DL766_009367 [Monosporascus sp. MC13-8B]